MNKTQLLAKLMGVLYNVSPLSYAHKASWITTPFIKNLIKKGEIVNLPVVMADNAIISYCHLITVINWLRDNSIKVYYGYALIYEDVVEDEWNDHTFAVKDNTIIEPTTWIRNKYFGYELSLEETYKFASMFLPILKHESVRIRHNVSLEEYEQWKIFIKSKP